MRADATPYYFNDRRFSPSQGPRTGLGPTRDWGLLYARGRRQLAPVPSHRKEEHAYPVRSLECMLAQPPDVGP